MSSGILCDGFPSVVRFQLLPALAFKIEEKESKPPGVDGGGGINTTSHRNTDVRTQWPKILYGHTAGTISASYNPEIYSTTQIEAMINQNQLIQWGFPDGSGVLLWGWVDRAEPGGMTEGEQPLVDFTIEISNRNNAKAETKPVYLTTTTTFGPTTTAAP